jgi:acyl carrier protein
MAIQKFIDDFISELDDDSIETLNSNVEFRGLAAWDSLSALSIMAMLDDKYGVTLTAEEMRSANTLEELFALVETKKA